MSERYDPGVAEPRWQRLWEERGLFDAKADSGRPKYYLLEMFPYPSGRIHMGHVRNYTIGDVVCRFKRMRGFEVFHPMGWDAFGLPAENAAIERGIHPAVWTRDNINYMRGQLKRLGLGYDWKLELATCEPEYYRWEQVLFIEMLERGLAYRKTGVVNWCPSCTTVLANDQAKDGHCERCGSEVGDKELEQWYFRTTAYGDALVDDLAQVEEGWPDSVLTMQRDWFGRSHGAELRFPVEGDEDRTIDVFTTRPDTVFGATFMSVAPEHPLAIEMSRGTEQEAAIDEFVARMRQIDRKDRAGDDQEKEGVFTGGFCINPATGKRIPVYAANFVLMEYGTGAVMAVPASDQRDFEFARKYDLPIIPVVDPPPPAEPLDAGSLTEAYVEPGIMRSSGQFDGMPNEEAKSAITAWLEAQGRGKHAVSWRLRDWCLSRQRYWGTPIPIIYCDSCGTVPVPAEDLPVRLPEDVQFTGKGESPLATHESFVRTICPTCGAAARRETDTMDTFVNSAWYFLRYTCASYTEGPIDRAASDRWMPVDQYIGGIEHATGHLIYSRFFHKLLRDLGYTAPDEPFVRLLTQGMVCKETRKCPVHGWIYPEEEEPSGAEDVPGTHRDCGERVEIGPSVKMSKSLKNVIDPEALIERYGADTARMFVLFASPPTKGLEWSDEGVEGIWRFLGRVWRLFEAHGAALVGVSPYAGDGSDLSGADKALRRKLHKTIDKVTSDIEDRLQFNTAIAAQMELLNLLMGRLEGADENPTPAVMRETIDALAHMLNPFAPHLAEELWASVGGERSLMEESWPEVDRAAAADDDVLYVVQVDGKTRGRITVDAGTGKEAILALAKESGSVPGHLDGRDMLREILVPKRLVNFVTRPKA